MKNDFDKTKEQLIEELIRMRSEANHPYAAKSNPIIPDPLGKDWHVLMRSLIDTLPILLYVKDRESRFIFCSAANARVMGVSDSNSVIGKTEFDFHPRHQAEKYFADEQEIIRTGESKIGMEEKVISADGTEHWYSTTKIPFYDDRGNIAGIFGTGLDITEHKQALDALRESQELLEKAERVAQLGCWKLDLKTEKISWSKEVYRIFGVSDFDGSRSTFFSFIHPADRERVREAIQKCLDEHSIYDIEHRIIRPDGTVCWVHERAEIGENNHSAAPSLIGTVHDITSHKNIADALDKSEAH